MVAASFSVSRCFLLNSFNTVSIKNPDSLPATSNALLLLFSFCSVLMTGLLAELIWTHESMISKVIFYLLIFLMQMCLPNEDECVKSQDNGFIYW